MTMRPMNEKAPPEVKAKVDRLVADLPFNEEIPRRSGEVSFDHAWEIRAFAIATAMHGEGAFAWPEFQGELIRSIEMWESSHDSTSGWSYYDRWVEALERLLGERGMLDIEELDHRTAEVLSLPANAHHQHAVREPLAVVQRPHTGGDST